MLKRIVLLIILIITFLIGINFKDNKLYYISLGDGLSKGINYNGYEGKGYSDFIASDLEKTKKIKFYTKEFSNEDDRITDLINKIEENIEIEVDNKKITIQSAISKADIITLSIGFNEIMYKYKNNTNTSYMYNYIDSYIKDMEKLIIMLRKYNNKKIYVLGYYNSSNNNDINKYIIYANDKLIKICTDKNTYYVNLYDIFKNNKKLIYNINTSFPNEEGYKLIANEILKSIKNM